MILSLNVYYYFSVCDRFFTDLSIELKKDLPGLQCSGYAYARRDCFLRFPFKKISFFSDINYRDNALVDYSFLTAIEKKYDFLISECIHAERNFAVYPSGKRLYIAQEMLRQILTDLEEIVPSIVLLEGLDDFASLFLYHYCKHTKTPIYYYVYARMGPYLIKSNRLDTGPVGFHERIKEAKQKLKIDKARSFLDETDSFITNYVKNKEQPSYVSNGTLLFKKISLEDFSRIVKAYKNYSRDKNAFGSEGNPLFFLLKRIKRIKRKNNYTAFFKKKFVLLENLQKKKFLIYPLHFHPEAATLIQGRWFNDQIRIIECISKALPIDVQLIVKEHKVSIGRRDVDFYKEIEQFHNVFFISENTNVYDLLGLSKGIVTISSSMGLEALMVGKPVLAFGDIFYQYSDNVIKATDLRKMKSYIEELLNKEIDKIDTLCLLYAFRTGLVKVTPGFSPHNYDLRSLKAISESVKKDLT